MRESIGKFQIRELIGKGAMGEVYLCTDPILGREVAVKTILPGTAFGDEAQARFEREARATGSLNHPNIVTVYEFGEDQGLHYLAMEYVRGEDLESLIRSGRLTRAQLLELVAQVCEGLGFAHARGIVHRDIKPANVLVAEGPRPLAKLMDFGVALISQSDLTQKGVWMGTVNYMAPEYLDTGKATPGSDLFAIGVVLYEIVTGGRKPFTGETVTTVLNAILRAEPAPIAAEEVQDLPPGTLDVVKKALARDPGDRYGSAEELAEAIRRALKPEEPSPAPLPLVGAVAGAGRRIPTDRLIIVGRGGKAHCLSLRVAIRQAEPGTRIILLPGTYRESVVVDREVEILGEGEASEIILESPKGPCLTFTGGRIVVRGVTLCKPWEEGRDPDPAPAVLQLSGQAELTDCRIHSDCEPGLSCQGSGTSLVLRNIRFEGESALGLVLRGGASAQLEGCHFRGQRLAGLQELEGSSATLKGCRFHAAPGVGLQLQGLSQATLEDCELDGREGGSLEVAGDSRVVLRRCRLQGSRFAGVLVMEKSQVFMEDSESSGHAGAGIHASGGASLHLRQCRLHGNAGFGVSLLEQSIGTLDECEIAANGHAGLLVSHGATVQLKQCRIHSGQSWGVVSSGRGRGVLEGCEVYGNQRGGGKVEPGGSLLLVRCTIRDSQDTGLVLFEDGEVTLEECVVHRNARGGILLARDASDPVLRGGNRIEDELLRVGPEGDLVKLTQLR
nr:right-handed parallel beta-helix repeat-containing protein [uncultured Holophaga sp.]